MARFPIEINQKSFENRTHHRTFKGVKLNFQCNRVPIEFNFKRYSFFKRVPSFQTSPILTNESHFLKRDKLNESHFKRVSSYFQTSLIFSNESHVFKRVSFLNRVPFQTSIVYESYRDDFYRVLLVWFTRNLE